MSAPEPEACPHGKPFSRARLLFFWAPVLLLLFADLWTKSWAFMMIGDGIVPVSGTWLAFVKVWNPGGVFGLGQNWTTTLTLIRVIAVFGLFVVAARQADHHRRGLFTLGLLSAGALGNLYDNLSRWLPWDGNGMVRDFVMVDLGSAPTWWPDVIPWLFHPWPIFNLADSCISVGFLLLIFGWAKVQWALNPSSS